MGERLNLYGTVRVNGQSYNNQVVDEGIKHILASMADIVAPPTKVTNMFLLSNFTHEGYELNELTFELIKSFIAEPACYQAFVGNSEILNEDGQRDMQVTLSSVAPFEMTIISTIPSDKGNTNPPFNAAVLVMGGDETQSVSNSATGYYNIAGTGQKLLSIVEFNTPYQKDALNPFTVLWYIRIANTE